MRVAERQTAFILLATIVASVLTLAATYPLTAVKASSSEASYPPENVKDGNATTRWSCSMAAAPCWLRLDVGAVKPINQVKITWHEGATHRYNFSLGIAGTDFNYRTVVSGLSAGTATGPEFYSFPAASGRYVKVTVTDNSTHNDKAAIAETIVNGTTSEPAPTPTPASDAGERDAFGILKKYATAPNGDTWTSAHWANGRPRTITGRDPDDPTGVSENRGDQATLFVNGAGVLEFQGSSSSSEPRLHLNGGANYFFNNVELTFYYMKQQDHDVNWGGMVIGARSGPDGHSNEYCDAHTYYGRFRNDGKYDFEKELKHPASSARTGTNIWNGATNLPANQWIGMKYMVYNVTVDGEPGVKLELYRDTTGGANGGTWQKIGESVDTGGWTPPQSGTACSGVPADYVPTTGGGVIVLRNTGSIKDSYKWMSAREITPPSA